MKEFEKIIARIQTGDDKEFENLLHRMNGLIMKYVRRLYKDEFDDIYSELSIALWQAAMSIKYFDNDGQIVKYLEMGVRNKYLELYRKSVKVHENEICIDRDDLTFVTRASKENPESEALVNAWIENVLNDCVGRTYEICYQILVEHKSDSEIAKNLRVSRQYVHRLRTNLAKKYLIDNKLE